MMSKDITAWPGKRGKHYSISRPISCKDNPFDISAPQHMKLQSYILKAEGWGSI